MEVSKLPGPLKAAILLQFLGADVAGKILERLDAKKRKLIEEHMAQIGTVP
ncbi:MAG: flagellar motor switch protein FliG, partial [Deltaproteobacteria bacterium]